jgi:SsrA-binding protein
MNICNNKKARHKYALDSEALEVGIALKGHEVKSLRTSAARLDKAYVIIKDNQLFLLNCYIGPYSFTPVSEPTRTRKLLAHKSQILELAQAMQQSGSVLIPLKMYFDKNHRAKVLIALAKGKQAHDKRSDLKREAVEQDERIKLKR